MRYTKSIPSIKTIVIKYHNRCLSHRNIEFSQLSKNRGLAVSIFVRIGNEEGKKTPPPLILYSYFKNLYLNTRRSLL